MTEDNKKLLEAANLIKENCKNLKLGNRCPFGKVMGICDGDINCTLANSDLVIPKDWKIPRVSRWSEADIALAKALMLFGVRSIYKEKYASSVRYEQQGKFDCNWFLPKNAFASLKQGEMEQLKDIIVEGENDG